MKLDYICSDPRCPPLEIKNLGNVLKVIRETLGHTQDSVYEETGLSINYLSRLENGHKGISIDKLNKLAKLYNVPAPIICILAIPAKGEFKDMISYVHKRIDDYL